MCFVAVDGNFTNSAPAILHACHDQSTVAKPVALHRLGTSSIAVRERSDTQLCTRGQSLLMGFIPVSSR